MYLLDATECRSCTGFTLRRGVQGGKLAKFSNSEILGGLNLCYFFTMNHLQSYETHLILCCASLGFASFQGSADALFRGGSGVRSPCCVNTSPAPVVSFHFSPSSRQLSLLLLCFCGLTLEIAVVCTAIESRLLLSGTIVECALLFFFTCDPIHLPVQYMHCLSCLSSIHTRSLKYAYTLRQARPRTLAFTLCVSV